MDNFTNNTDETLIDKRKVKYPGPVTAGFFFSLTAILLIYAAPLLPFKNGYLKSGMGEVLLVLVPTLVFLIAGRYSIKDTLKLNKTRPINYLIVFGLMIFAIPVVGAFSALILGIIRVAFGRNLPIERFVIPDVPTLFAALVVIGLSAAVCEETLFRGLVLKGYRRLGAVGSIVLTSLLFGILHRDLQKAVPTILLGALISFIVYRTNTIFTGMLAHFTNNAAAVLILFGAQELSKKLYGGNFDINKSQQLDFSKIPMASMIIVIVFYGMVFLGFLASFIGLMYAFIKCTKHSTPKEPLPEDKIEASRLSVWAYLSMLPGILLIVLTFVGQVLYLLNIKSGGLYDILRLLKLLTYK